MFASSNYALLCAISIGYCFFLFAFLFDTWQSYLQEEFQEKKIHDFDLIRNEKYDIYGFLTKYFMHLDRLCWSRLQTIAAIEVGILAAAINVKSEIYLFVGVMIFGNFFIWLTWRLIRRDRHIMSDLTSKLDFFHDKCKLQMTVRAKNIFYKGLFLLQIQIYLLLSFNLIIIHLRINNILPIAKVAKLSID